MKAGAYAGFLQFTVALQKFVIAVASVDDLSCFIVDGLQAKLHSEMGLAVYVTEQGNNIIGKAVGPCEIPCTPKSSAAVYASLSVAAGAYVLVFA